MIITPESWKKQTRQNLAEKPGWLDRLKSQYAPLAVYGYLSSLALWPLLDALGAGQVFPVMNALGAVAGNIGGNLLANRLEAWRQQAEALSPEALGAIIQQEVAAQSELREALDSVLEKLEVIPETHQSLTDAERHWFVEILRQELAQLGAFKQQAANLVGPGIIIQDSALSGGDRSVIASQARIIVTGDNNTLVISAADEALNPAAADHLRQAYLNRLYHSCLPLSLAGIDRRAASDETAARVTLGAVYTALLTLTPEQHERYNQGDQLERAEKRLSALAQLNQQRHLVLLGDPGSGKSTFVNFVAMCLAGAGLEGMAYNLETLTAPLPDEKGQDQEARQPWQHGPLLPVRVILRDFAAEGLPPVDRPATAQHLWRFIVRDLESASLGDYAETLQAGLRDPQAGGLLLLDGLDEVPEAGRRRGQIKAAVEDFSRAYPACRILITSRTYAYQKQDWRLPAFAEAVLAPFSRGQIIRFVERWYAHVALLRGQKAEEAQGQAELLKRAIFAAARLHELAERPLLLTLMASLHAWRGGTLPEKREELYADAVELLLDTWETRKVKRDAQGRVISIEEPSLTEWLKVDRTAVRQLLNRLAYEAHAKQPDMVGTADVPQGDLVTGLMDLTRSDEVNPTRLVRYLSQRAGLLLPRGVGVYTFPHRTFQEYLAACHLVNETYPDPLCDLARTAPDRWREVALLAAANAGRQTIWSLVEALCPGDPPREPSPTKAALPDVWGAHLAGQAVVEVADIVNIPNRHKPKLERVKQWLIHLIEQAALPAVERALAGRNLATLGDPRPEVTTLERMQFCYVPPGPFMMGSPADDAPYDDEKPLHEQNLAYSYWIGRYPITVGQFKTFVIDQNFKLEDQDSLKDPLNHPVRYVTWHEALAFCQWLTEQWHQKKLLPAGWQITLPSEAEWEKAARGGREIPAEPVIRSLPGLDLAGFANLPDLIPNPLPQRVYPWGDKADPERANYGDTNLGDPSPVGCFLNGQSRYGAAELSGNVWEWTRSIIKDYPYKPEDGRENLKAGDDARRVLRGGAFFSRAGYARCALRFASSPDLRLRYDGFRVVCCPHFSSSDR